MISPEQHQIQQMIAVLRMADAAIEQNQPAQNVLEILGTIRPSLEFNTQFWQMKAGVTPAPGAPPKPAPAKVQPTEAKASKAKAKPDEPVLQVVKKRDRPVPARAQDGSGEPDQRPPVQSGGAEVHAGPRPDLGTDGANAGRPESDEAHPSKPLLPQEGGDHVDQLRGIHRKGSGCGSDGNRGGDQTMPTAVIERMKLTGAGLLAGEDPVPEVREPKIKPVHNKSQLKPEGRAEAQAKACNPKRAAKAHGGPGPVKEPGSRPWRPPIPDTIDPKRSPIRVDTRQQPAPKPTVEPVRISTKPQPTRATDAGLMPKPMPRMTQPKQKGQFDGRWIDAAVQQANSRVKPPVPAGKRSYQAGPFWTDNLSLRLTLPRSEYPMQQKIQDRFTAEHGAMLEKTYPNYEAAQAAADQAAKIFAGMAVRTGVTADIDDVLDDDD